MRHSRIQRRSFLGALTGLPAGFLGVPQTPGPAGGSGVRVAAGESRPGGVLTLPDGTPLFIKVSSADTAGAFFLTEQPTRQRGGPPTHYHLEEDEWFYCLEGEYVVGVGDRRHPLRPGDSVLGPRGVPHAFALVSHTPGRLLVGFTPAGRMEQFFRDLDARGRYFGSGTDADRAVLRDKYGIVNVGPAIEI
jgi:quercetin dioxygenase-like cupin family protein